MRESAILHQVSQYVFKSWNMLKMRTETHTHTQTYSRTHANTLTHTCCDIFIFEVSWPSVHSNWFMLTGSLGISQHWIKSAHTPTDRTPTALTGCTRRCPCSLISILILYINWDLRCTRKRKAGLVGAQGAAKLRTQCCTLRQLSPSSLVFRLIWNIK